jgi:hypothetical protein
MRSASPIDRGAQRPPFEKAFVLVNQRRRYQAAPAMVEVVQYWPVRTDEHRRLIEQLNARPVGETTGEQRWRTYLDALPAQHWSSPEVVAAARRVWLRLRNHVEAITPPDASPTEDGTLIMSWSQNEHHLEIEIMPNDTYVWFYRHHASDREAYGDGVRTDALPQELIESALQLFAQ